MLTVFREMRSKNVEAEHHRQISPAGFLRGIGMGFCCALCLDISEAVLNYLVCSRAGHDNVLFVVDCPARL